MKFNTILIAVLLMCGSFSTATNAGSAKSRMTISWEFKNIEPGYDHQSKLKVWVDNSLVAESKQILQSKPGKLKLKLNGGKHHLKIMSLAFYKDKWEEHTVANGYSKDCSYESDITVTAKKSEIRLTFDLDNGTSHTLKGITR